MLDIKKRFFKGSRVCGRAAVRSVSGICRHAPSSHRFESGWQTFLWNIIMPIFSTPFLRLKYITEVSVDPQHQTLLCWKILANPWSKWWCVELSAHPCIRPCVLASVRAFICPSAHASIYSSMLLSMLASTCLSLCVSLCLYLDISVSLPDSACLCIWRQARATTALRAHRSASSSLHQWSDTNGDDPGNWQKHSLPAHSGTAHTTANRKFMVQRHLQCPHWSAVRLYFYQTVPSIILLSRYRRLRLTRANVGLHKLRF